MTPDKDLLQGHAHPPCENYFARIVVLKVGPGLVASSSSSEGKVLHWPRLLPAASPSYLAIYVPAEGV